MSQFHAGRELSLVKTNGVDYHPFMKRRSGALAPYLYFLPALILAVLFSYYPFIKTLLNSLSIVSYGGKITSFVGFDNFKALLRDQNFQKSLFNTFKFALLFIPLDLLLSLSLALLIYKKRKFNGFNEALIMLPMAVAMSSAALVFKALFNPTIGVVNFLLNLSIDWFNSPTWAMFTIVFLGVWMAVSLDFLLLLGALRSIPRDLSEAAELEGASKVTKFFRLQLPLISPTIMFIITTRLRDSMLLSGPVLVMTEGGPYRSTQTLVYQMYIEGFAGGNYAKGSTISVVVFLLTFILILLAFRFEKKGVFYQ
jgi:sn-glycerol 3-phosphate transport system permease protein